MYLFVCYSLVRHFFYSGSLCQEEGSEESRVLISDGETTEDCSECSSESGCDWESESDEVYLPTPDCARLGKVSPVPFTCMFTVR